MKKLMAVTAVVVGLTFTAPITFEDKPPSETGGENGPAPAEAADRSQAPDIENRW